MPPDTRTRHLAFRNNRGPIPALDPCPSALTPAEVEHIEGRILAGQSPSARYIRKMLKLCPKQKSEP